MKKTLYFVFLFLFLLSSHSVKAQENKVYFYKNFDVNISVQKDATFTVEEKQLYSYKGNFNKGYRDIPLDKLSDIKDISVIDGQTGQALIYSSSILDKTDPSSWGKYTYYKKDGEMIIEWYYNLADTDYLWILNYKVYGGLGFYNDHDEVYWNVFTNYDVPIASSTVYVNLPPNSFVSTDFTTAAYTNSSANNPRKLYRDSDHMFEYFTAGPFSSKENFTIALGWPKGLIDESSFWKYWFSANWSYLASGLIVLLTIIGLFIYWLFKEKLKKGRGTIIAEYEPPHSLPPAMAELIVTERNTPRAWSATIVDLAVRGYVKIEEETVSYSGKIIKLIFSSLLILFMALIFIADAKSFSGGVFVAVIFIIIVVSTLFKKDKDYKVLKLKNFESDEILHDYEKGFLRVLFAGRESFSTSEMKAASNSEKVLMHRDMVELSKSLLEELSIDETAEYDVSIKEQSRFNFIYVLPFICATVVFVIVANFQDEASTPYLVLTAVILWALATIRFFIKYNPRLSKEGIVLREEWLGFKLYLETAEKYRMQNLTPEIFEKYLPYAIIFKVEKQWAKNFDSIVKGEPSWYGSASHGVYVGSMASGTAGVGNFSASAFSTSFSSSLSSAFASSGASGGGGSGGGGGGGGGGAS
ncbi:MAG: DUF2207 domain-containing protein [bacterium]